MKTFALANSATADMHVVPPEETIEATRFAFALGNEAPIDDDGWGLIAPFGDWPKTRLYRENGQVKSQQFIQVLDNDSADAMVSKENSFFGKLKRAVVGIPIYKGHGDLNDADPAAVSNEKQKIKLGVVDQIRKSARGIEAHFALDNDGATAVAEGYKFPSAFWWVLPNGKRGDAILAKPFKLISVALTHSPNISGVESLANARTHQTQPAETPNNDIMLKDKLTGALIGRGITLPANPTEDQLIAALPNDASDGDGDDADAATAKAHRASAIAAKKGDAQSHLKAAVAHQDAEAASDDADTKAMHNANAKYHTKMAANC